MTRPQQPELRRSDQTPEMNPDAIAGELAAHERPSRGARGGAPVPEANRPGRGAGDGPDTPDLDAFARKIGADARTPEDRDAAAEAITSTGGRLSGPLRVIGLAAAAAGVVIGVVRGLRAVADR